MDNPVKALQGHTGLIKTQPQEDSTGMPLIPIMRMKTAIDYMMELSATLEQKVQEMTNLPSP